MHIGIVPYSNPSHGGSYQYSLALLDALTTAVVQNSGGRHRGTVIVRSNRDTSWLNGSGASLEHAMCPYSGRERFIEMVEQSVGNGWLRDTVMTAAYRLAPATLRDPDKIWSNKTARDFFRNRGIDWMIYTTPNPQSFEVGLPYVMPVYDLQHRLQPGFPEVSANGAWERREYLYRNGTRYATLVLADSEVGKEDILHYYGRYGLTPDRIRVLPYVPPPYLTRDVSADVRKKVRRTYKLPERYLFYPAQLWPHKNHVRLVQAMGLLREQGLQVHLVLCGTHSGTIRATVLRDLIREARRLGVVEQLTYLGYVSNEMMSALYAEALALAMPTFFGPTNIPIVEAWLFGCPVLTSDIRGIREHIADAGLLVNPRSVECIADGLRRLWEDKALRDELSRRGLQRLSDYNHEHFSKLVSDLVDEASVRARNHKGSVHCSIPTMAATST
jgi:glycosyltransferase involved in cell wall biosynthesis